MIVAKDTPTREAALKDILPFQRDDFKGIFHAMSGLPVSIRLLDPPLHEFLPCGELDDVCEVLSEDTGESEDEIIRQVEKLSRSTPCSDSRVPFRNLLPGDRSYASSRDF